MSSDALQPPTTPPAGPPPPSPAPAPEEAGSKAIAEALSSSFALIKLVMIGLVLVFLFSNFFIVGPQERAMVLRFGRPVGEGERVLKGPGLHFAMPYPIDEVIRIPISQIQRVRSTTGWYYTTPEQELAGAEPFASPSLNPNSDGYVLTADGNILHAYAELSYRITDPKRFVLDFTNAPAALRDALDNALVQTAARFTVDDILTRNVAGFKEAVVRETTRLIEVRQLGVTVDQGDVRTRPPLFLKEAFNRVLQTEVERSKRLNDAKTYENQVLSRASAESTNRVNLAESARTRLVESTAAQAGQFKEILPKYQEAPDLFVQQRLTEVIGRVMTNAQDKIFLANRPDQQPRELRLLLNREPVKAASPK